MLMKNLLFFLLLFPLASFAQFADSLREVVRHKSSIDARLESRYSFMDHRLISVSGVRLGIAFQRKLRIGGGISWLSTELAEEKSPFYRDIRPAGVNRYFKFVYLCYYADFVFHKTKRWQLSVPIQAGGGLSWFQDKTGYSFSNRDPKYLLLLYEPGITAQFKVFKWAGLGADVAYRFTLKNRQKISGQLNSPTYSFKILFWFDQLFYELFPESELTKRFGPGFW
jgi:hypothetical protein